MTFLGNARDQNWVNRMKEKYQNPEEYKESLKEQIDVHWEQARTGGINPEMTKKVEEENRQMEQARLKAEEEKRIKELGPNFPKV